MPHLSLSLLGPFQAALDGQPITGFRANKVRALLAYLAVEASQPWPRTVLAGLFWPEHPERAALASLRNALANLRTAIGDRTPTGDRDAASSLLQITRETIQFDGSGDYRLDLAAFQALVEGRTGADRPEKERLEEAVALYRGDLLEGFSVRGSPGFEDWALLLRERLQRQFLDALRRLIAHYEDHEEVARACELARHRVARAPWEEGAHRALMRALAASGQRRAALAQYEACRQALAQELGVEPGPETAALYERIRAGDLDPLALPPFLSAAPADDRPALPFVARDRELAQLDGYLAEALAGQGRVVFVTGEAGTGKTTLVREWSRRAQEQHARLIVAGGDCNAYTGIGDPYLPFREILGQLTGDVEPRWAAGALSTEGARRLWRTLPLAIRSLLEVGPSLIGALLASSPLATRAAMAAPRGARWRDRLESSLAGDETDRVQARLRPVDLYAQVSALLGALSREHLLLLTVDDLQWADAGSIDLLFHLGRRLAGSRILVVGTYRPSEMALGRDGERHPLAPLIHEFQRQYGAIEVDLPQTGGRRFVEAFLDSEPNRLGNGFREALYRHTEGHALCTVEMLRDMQERGDLVQDAAGRWIEGPAVDWGSLPERVEGAIGERLDRLPAALRETLKVACVEGETFTAEVVARVRGATAYETVAQLGGELDRRHRLVASEGSQLVGSAGVRASRYRFRHILFQAYAYDSLDEAEQAYLHEAVGSALEQLYAGQTEAIAVQLARHFWAASQMDKAAEYSLQAGDRARGLYAYPEAQGHYARALEALGRLPDTEGNRRRRVDALIAQASSSLRIDPPERNLARLAEAERLVRDAFSRKEIPREDRLRLARVHFWMGFAQHMGGAYLKAIAYYEQALSAAQALGDGELIGLASSAIGQVRSLQGHEGRAKALLGQAIPLLEKTGHWSEWFRAQGYYGVVLAIMGDYQEGLAEIQRARAWAKQRNALTEIVQSSFFLNAAHIEGGDLSRALAASRHLAEMAEQLGDRIYIYVGHFHQSWAACRAGQVGAAAAHADKAREMAQELGEPLVHSDDLAAVRAEIALGAGRAPEAVALAEQAVGTAQEMGGIFAEGKARRTWGQALAALETPQWDEAEGQLAHSLRLFEEGQARLEAARTHEAWGAVCRGRGDLDGARAHWEQAAAQWERSGLSHELARTRALIESMASE